MPTNNTRLSESAGQSPARGQPWWAALRELLQEALPAYLLRQRWYPAKDAGVPAVLPIRFVPYSTEDITAAVAIWQVSPPGRPPFKMFIPVALVDRPPKQPHLLISEVDLPGEKSSGAIVDAFSLDGFVQAWVELQLGGRSEALTHVLAAKHTPFLARSGLAGGGDRSIRAGAADQTNTSIRIGERAILKVFRKLEEGLHPELEVGRYLTMAGFTAAPPILAWIEALEGEDAPSTLSVLQPFVPNEGDGWTWLLQQLKRGLMDQHEHEAALLETFTWLQVLARRTAEMHRTFAANTEEAAFRPEPVGRADLGRWVEAALSMAARAFQALEGGPAGKPAEPIPGVSELSERKMQVETALAGVAELSATFTKTRHHGDFHLGQTLVVTGPDAVILDFEGEPLRPLEERRAKHCVLRDVAGMLRSLSYAAGAAERALPEDATVEIRQSALNRIAQWRARASGLFTDCYFSAARGISSVPAGREHAEHLLRFFLLEKALYEIAYESANRPEWIGIPLHGALSLLQQNGRASP